MKSAIIAIGLIEDYNNHISVETHNLFKTQLLLEKMFMYVFITTTCIFSTKHLLGKSIFSAIGKIKAPKKKIKVS